MSDVEAQKAEGETDKASLTEDPKELMRQAIRKRHRNYLVGFFVVVFFILIISFCAFRQPRISWRCVCVPHVYYTKLTNARCTIQCQRLS